MPPITLPLDPIHSQWHITTSNIRSPRQPPLNQTINDERIQREKILEERAADRQRVQNARMLVDLVRSQKRGGAVAAEGSWRSFCSRWMIS
jgi:hypothetical protein